MIQELTKEQEALMDTITKEYEDYCLGGDDSYDEEKTRKGIDFIYKLTDLKPPAIRVFNSPFAMCREFGLKKGETFDNIGCGFHSGWIAFYDYFNRIGVEYDKSCGFSELKDFIRYSGVFCTLLYANVAGVAIRPCEVHRKDENLHNEKGMAIKWRDGFGIYALNGVIVPEYLVMTPEGQLDIEFWKKEKNADVKAEFIRKFGVERMAHMGKVVDSYRKYNNEWYKKSEYELIDMSGIFTSLKYQPCLKMKNQTTGIWHMEFVSPDCRTIDEAIRFRCGEGGIQIVSIK